MRFLSSITRSLIAAATTLHIGALRVAVWGADRAVKAAGKITDATDAAAAAARDIRDAAYNAADAMVDAADEASREAWELEKAAIKASNEFRNEANDEIAVLRRGVRF